MLSAASNADSQPRREQSLRARRGCWWRVGRSQGRHCSRPNVLGRERQCRDTRTGNHWRTVRTHGGCSGDSPEAAFQTTQAQVSSPYFGFEEVGVVWIDRLDVRGRVGLARAGVGGGQQPCKRAVAAGSPRHWTHSGRARRTFPLPPPKNRNAFGWLPLMPAKWRGMWVCV